MRYQFVLQCPRCDKISQAVSEKESPHLNCGDCLVSAVEVVPLMVIGMKRDDQEKTDGKDRA